MDLSNLAKTTEKSKKRIGRGAGSGKGGHTVGRGKYGQKSREKIFPLFQGTKLKKSLLKRLPLKRGKGKFKSLKSSPIIINVKFLSLFKPQEEVTLESLTKKGIIRHEAGSKTEVKILGEGDLKLPLIVRLPTSKGARTKIEKAGGRVEIEDLKNKKTERLKNKEEEDEGKKNDKKN